MGKITELRGYTKEADIQHVTFKAQERTQCFNCPVCGMLPVISGVVVHTEPDEDHVTM
ncbi:hypothetical protein KAR91_09055 [Candidatus Pacearchaeota archaeon]|nr:hypothetical protein [Candidatus Pacearchaeota archaeon]